MASNASISTFSLCSTLLPCMPFSHRMIRIGPHQSTKRVISTTTITASGNEAHDRNPNQYDGSGRSVVDENLIVLRKRIHETKMIERNYEPPSQWMAWEKNCYAGYDEFVCEAVGLLQLLLMNTRPSLTLGTVALLAISVPTSAAVVFFHVAEMAQGNLAGGIHLMN